MWPIKGTRERNPTKRQILHNMSTVGQQWKWWTILLPGQDKESVFASQCSLDCRVHLTAGGIGRTFYDHFYTLTEWRCRLISMKLLRVLQDAHSDLKMTTRGLCESAEDLSIAPFSIIFPPHDYHWLCSIRNPDWALFHLVLLVLSCDSVSRQQMNDYTLSRLSKTWFVE